MIKILSLFMLSLIMAACATPFSKLTPAEKESGYTYIPIDPFSVETTRGEGCKVPKKTSQKKCPKCPKCPKFVYKNLFESLPDNAVRMSVEKFDTSGAVSYGPAGFGAQDESYRVTVDYVNSDTTNFSVMIKKEAMNVKKNKLEVVDLLVPLDTDKYTPDSEVYSVLSKRDYEKFKNKLETEDKTKKQKATSTKKGEKTNNNGFWGSLISSVFKLKAEKDEYVEYNIPIYVGVGLRVTANVDITAANANISGLGVIGAEAEANSLKGSLIVQTLGINGQSIAAALPIQSELNRTTAQNAIVAVGSIKALLYDDNITTSPRVVGMYLPFPGGKPLVNRIISELSKGKVKWKRPCELEKKIKIN